MNSNDEYGGAIPHEQYDHISRAMDHLGKVDDREIPSEHARRIEEFWSYLDNLYDLVEDEEGSGLDFHGFVEGDD